VLEQSLVSSSSVLILAVTVGSLDRFRSCGVTWTHDFWRFLLVANTGLVLGVTVATASWFPVQVITLRLLRVGSLSFFLTVTVASCSFSSCVPLFPSFLTGPAPTGTGLVLGVTTVATVSWFPVQVTTLRLLRVGSLTFFLTVTVASCSFSSCVPLFPSFLTGPAPTGTCACCEWAH
jgi:hypothetical protein